MNILNVNFMFYGIALGYGPVHMWRNRCQFEVLSTRTGPVRRGTVTCIFCSHLQLLFTLGRETYVVLLSRKTHYTRKSDPNPEAFISLIPENNFLSSRSDSLVAFFKVHT